jgi:endonuclease G
MQIDLLHRPGLSGMLRLGGGSTPPAAVAGGVEARKLGPRVSPPEMFAGRQGYDPGFLGDFAVPPPKPVGARQADVLTIGDGRDRLDYMHFSVVMSQSRKMALFVGVNISGANSVAVNRTSDKWALDGRIPLDAQLGEDLYADNLLDRGHLVRREDPNWGTEADVATANEDTFHFTNCSPQMAAFNQQTWLSLEDYILQNTRRWRERVSVFSGPVFRDDDRVYRGARIPTAYWKVVAFVSDAGKPSATAYMIDQARELGGLEAAFGRFKTYQRSILYIQSVTDLDFGELSLFDGFSNEERAQGVHIEAEIDSPGAIRV